MAIFRRLFTSCLVCLASSITHGWFQVSNDRQMAKVKVHGKPSFLSDRSVMHQDPLAVCVFLSQSTAFIQQNTLLVSVCDKRSLCPQSKCAFSSSAFLNGNGFAASSVLHHRSTLAQYSRSNTCLFGKFRNEEGYYQRGSGNQRDRKEGMPWLKQTNHSGDTGEGRGSIGAPWPRRPVAVSSHLDRRK